MAIICTFYNNITCTIPAYLLPLFAIVFSSSPFTDHAVAAVLNLALPSVKKLYVNHYKLITAVNEHAELHDYAVVMKRSKKSRQGVICKVTLRCDRGGKPNNVVG